MKKNIIITVAIITIFLLSGISIHYIKAQYKTLKVEGKVKYIKDNYIIIEDDKGKSYKLVTKDNFFKEDTISVTLKKVNKNKNPIEGEIVQINLLSRSVELPTETTNNNIDKGIIDEKKENSNTSDETIINYFEELNNNLDNYNQSKNIEEKIKNAFITITDFLFYEKPIKNKTFKELSDNTKIQILKIYVIIDNKIEDKFPNYKQEISKKSGKTYTNLKDKALELYSNTTEKICTYNETLCQTAKKDSEKLKENITLTWDIIKDISIKGKNKIKKWYETWRDSND